MRALVIYCHPRQGSFTEAVRDVVLEKLTAIGAEVRLRDLYAEGFDPVLSAREHEIYEDEALNRAPVVSHCADLAWCDTLIFVYPTWWYGLPAMIKGWLDRVLVPGLAFSDAGRGEHRHSPRPDAYPAARRLHHLRCEFFWLDADDRCAGQAATLLRGLRLLLREELQDGFRGALPDGQFHPPKAGRSTSSASPPRWTGLVGKAPAHPQKKRPPLDPGGFLGFHPFLSRHGSRGLPWPTSAPRRGGRGSFFSRARGSIRTCRRRVFRAGREVLRASPGGPKGGPCSIPEDPALTADGAHDGLESLDETSGLRDRKERLPI